MADKFLGVGCSLITSLIVRGQSYFSRLPKYWPPIPRAPVYSTAVLIGWETPQPPTLPYTRALLVNRSQLLYGPHLAPTCQVTRIPQIPSRRYFPYSTFLLSALNSSCGGHCVHSVDMACCVPGTWRGAEMPGPSGRSGFQSIIHWCVGLGRANHVFFLKKRGKLNSYITRGRFIFRKIIYMVYSIM